MSWSNIRKKLSQLPDRQLITEIRDLYQLNKENKRFLEMRFSSNVEADISSYKKIISTNICPDPPKPLKLSVAKKAIQEFKKAVKNDKEMMELMIYYVEKGVEFTLMYGDIDAAFYASLESMFSSVIENLKTHVGLQQQFLPRAIEIVHSTKNIGWGFHDYLYQTLKEAFPTTKI